MSEDTYGEEDDEEGDEDKVKIVNQGVMACDVSPVAMFLALPRCRIDICKFAASLDQG